LKSLKLKIESLKRS